MINCKDIAFIYDSVEEYDAEIKKCEYALDRLKDTIQPNGDGGYEIPTVYDRVMMRLIYLKKERKEFILEKERRIK